MSIRSGSFLVEAGVWIQNRIVVLITPECGFRFEIGLMLKRYIFHFRDQSFKVLVTWIAIMIK